MITMNTELFHNHTAAGETPVLVEFWAPWCSYCRRINPVLKKVAQQYAGNLVVGQINIDEESQLAWDEQIEIIPTLVLYRKGQVLGSVVAPESRDRIEAFLQNALGA